MIKNCRQQNMPVKILISILTKIFNCLSFHRPGFSLLRGISTEIFLNVSVRANLTKQQKYNGMNQPYQAEYVFSKLKCIRNSPCDTIT